MYNARAGRHVSFLTNYSAVPPLSVGACNACTPKLLMLYVADHAAGARSSESPSTVSHRRPVVEATSTPPVGPEEPEASYALSK